MLLGIEILFNLLPRNIKFSIRVRPDGNVNEVNPLAQKVFIPVPVLFPIIVTLFGILMLDNAVQ